jgi:hypothetical protein
MVYFRLWCTFGYGVLSVMVYVRFLLSLTKINNVTIRGLVRSIFCLLGAMTFGCLLSLMRVSTLLVAGRGLDHVPLQTSLEECASDAQS